MQARNGNNAPPRQQLVPPALFGDAFGTRGDYSKGIFYAGRRKYLGDSEEPEQNNLRPPLYFMTRNQRMKNSLRSNGVRLLQKLDFKKDEDAGKPARSDIALLTRTKSIKQSRRSSVTLRKFQGMNAGDWRREFQAGCYFWVNKVTGEISAECPPEVLQSSSVIHEEPHRAVADDDIFEVDDDCPIDNPELRQIFDLLDTTSSPIKRGGSPGRSTH